MVNLLIGAAEEAGTGLINGEDFLMVYANDIRNMLKFAKSVIGSSAQFRSLVLRSQAKRSAPEKSDSEQLGLFDDLTRV